MAAGDVTVDVGSPKQMGSIWVLTGSVEIDTTLRTFDIAGSKSTLIDLTLVSQSGIGSAKSTLNQDANGATANGSAAIQAAEEGVYWDADGASETFRFIAHFV